MNSYDILMQDISWKCMSQIAEKKPKVPVSVNTLKVL